MSPRTMPPGVRRWLLTLAALLILVGTVGLLGGFADRRPPRVPAVAVGEPVGLGRADVVVRGVDWQSLGEHGALRVRLTITNTTHEPVRIGSDQVRLRLPDGTVLPRVDDYGHVVQSATGLAFDPGLPTEATFTVQQGPATMPPEVTVMIGDEGPVPDEGIHVDRRAFTHWVADIPTPVREDAW